VHHSIKVDEIKAHRDKAFDEYWRKLKQTAGSGANPDMVRIICEIIREAFDAGYSQGLVKGAREGASATAAVIANDIMDIAGIELPESG